MADVDSRAGLRYATPEILDYTARVHVPHDRALEAAFRAPEERGLPPIQVGPSEGATIALLLRLAGARRVVEIGTLAGYSALWIARALPEDGLLYTIDHDPKASEIARQNIEAAGLGSKVRFLVGDGVATLPAIASEGPFCAVFVDADKGRYDLYGRWARDHLREGGLLIGDNAYFFGKLLDPVDAAAAAMRRFHEEMGEAFDSVCIPTPDGLAVGIKSSHSRMIPTRLD